MSRNACNPRGFATTTALIYMGVLAVVIGLMSVNLATNVHRTVSARREAQFRQLLIAGAISARSHLEQETAEKEWRLDVPNANDSQPSVAIELPSTSGENTEAKVIVSLDGVSHSERVRFEKRGGRWMMISSEMD